MKIQHVWRILNNEMGKSKRQPSFPSILRPNGELITAPKDNLHVLCEYYQTTMHVIKTPALLLEEIELQLSLLRIGDTPVRNQKYSQYFKHKQCVILIVKIWLGFSRPGQESD